MEVALGPARRAALRIKERACRSAWHPKSGLRKGRHCQLIASSCLRLWPVSPRPHARSSRRRKGAQDGEGHVARANPSRVAPAGAWGCGGCGRCSGPLPAPPRPRRAADSRQSVSQGRRSSMPQPAPGPASPPAAHPRRRAGEGGEGRGGGAEWSGEQPGAGGSRPPGPPLPPLPAPPPPASALEFDVSSALRPPLPHPHPRPGCRSLRGLPDLPTTRVREGRGPSGSQVPLGASPSSPPPGAGPASTPRGVCKASGWPHPGGS